MGSTRWLVAATFGLLMVAPSTAGATVAFERQDLPAGGQPLSVAVGDLDGAHGPDIVVALYDVNRLSVRLNRGDGTFADPVLADPALPPATTCGPIQVELSDVTSNGSDYVRDGRLDAVVQCLDTSRVVRMAGDGAGGLAAPTQSGPLSDGAALSGSDFFALARMRENDGPPLLLMRKPAPDFKHMLCASYDWANAAPCLSPSPPESHPAIGGPLVAGDVNGGGLEEVVSIEGSTRVAIFGIAPGPVFASSTRDFGTSSSSGARRVAVGDLEPDGHPDIVTGWGDSSNGAVNVLHGDASGLPDLAAQTFPSVAGLNQLAIDDFDGDGHNDVLVATGYGRAVVHSGDGAGNIGSPQDVPLVGYQNPASATYVELAVADLDGNGSRDAVILDQYNQLVQILRNTVPAYAPPTTGGGPSPVVPPPPTKKLAPLAGLKGLRATAAATRKSIVSLGSATNPPTASVSVTLKAKALTVGKASLKIPAGKTRALKVKLNKKGQALLRRNRKLKVSVKFVATAPDGTSATRKRSLTIRRPR